MAHHQNIGEWHGKTLVDRDGQKIGKLEDVYVDVETDQPMFGTTSGRSAFRREHPDLERCPRDGGQVGPGWRSGARNRSAVPAHDAPACSRSGSSGGGRSGCC
jgi:hypothetical protein